MHRACYLWNEIHEVASALFSCLGGLRNQRVTTVYLFLNCCVGHNSYRNVFAILPYALDILKFSEICLNFLVTDHSQNLNNDTHAPQLKEGQKMFKYLQPQSGKL